MGGMRRSPGSVGGRWLGKNRPSALDRARGRGHSVRGGDGYPRAGVWVWPGMPEAGTAATVPTPASARTAEASAARCCAR